MFCKKIEFRPSNNEREYPTRVTTDLTATNILKTATLKKEKEMIDKISGVNLMEKDFRKHRSCLRDYTSIAQKRWQFNRWIYYCTANCKRDDNGEATVHVLRFSDGYQRDKNEQHGDTTYYEVMAN